MLDRLMLRGPFCRCLAVAGAVFFLASCGTFPQQGAGAPQNALDQAVASMAMGNTDAARRQAAAILEENPTNPLALLIYGMAAERKGNEPRARLAYQRILDLPPAKREGMETTIGLRKGEARALPVHVIARRRLKDLKPEVSDGAGTPDEAADTEAAPAVGRPDLLPFDPDVAKRFRVLKRLHRQGMITRDEFRKRRQANLGALLRYSHDPPARGLDRPVPDARHVIDRLRFLGNAVEKGSISPRQQDAERGAILDALLPDDPERRAPPPPSPSDMLDMAALYGRLEALQEKGLISRAELRKEKRALDALTAPEPEEAPMTNGSGDGTAPMRGGEGDGGEKDTPDEPAAKGTPTGLAAGGDRAMGVHVASYRSPEQAERGWQRLQEKFPDALGDRDYHLKTVNLGQDRGVFHRLVVGPFEDRDAAAGLCDKLKKRNQFCKPTLYGGQ